MTGKNIENGTRKNEVDVSVKIIFFASIRETLGCHILDCTESVPNISGLIAHLVAKGGDKWHEALTAENVRVAVNQELVNGDVGICDGDEVAFFPPVTGG